MTALGDSFYGHEGVKLLTIIRALKCLRLGPEKGFFCCEREVNSGWPALKEIRWKEKSKNFGKIFRKMFNRHFGDIRII